MSGDIDWGGGLEQLAQELETLPDRLLNDVIDPVMKAEIDEAAERMKNKYAFDSLSDGVTVQKRGPGDYKISNRAPHAHLYELGTQARVTSTGHRTGRMPAKPVLIPEAIDARQRITNGVTKDVGKLRSQVLDFTP